MDKALQQRILGAMVLVALGVIFIPALLDGSGLRSREVSTIAIPPPPELPPTRQTRLAPVATPVDDSKLALEARQKTPVTPALQSFALQVATFSTRDKADGFAATMRKYGHSFVDDMSKEGKSSYRVRIGPDMDRARLEKLRDQLQKDAKITGFITQYP
jgi:DedD protein